MRSRPPGGPCSEDGLAALGLLEGCPDSDVTLRLPVAVFLDPAAWVVGVARSTSADPAAAAVAALDAVAALVAPERGADPGWPLADGVRLDYANESGALRLTLTGTATADLGGHDTGRDRDRGRTARPGSWRRARSST